MKPIISFILLITILLQTFSSLVIVAGYEMNKDFITKNLCVNKSKPAMHCNGKCHMQAQLAKQTEKEQAPSSPLKEKYEIVNYFQKDIKISFDLFFDKSNPAPFYLQTTLPEMCFSIFHPPAC